MDLNEYALTTLVEERLTSARDAAARRALVRSGPPARPLRQALGAALIRAGQWIAGIAPRGATPLHQPGRG